MATSVKKLYKTGVSHYHLNLIAGNKGLSNLVTWVHMIEDSTASKFLQGGEFVITTGIAKLTKEELIQFTKDLHSAGASAFTINTGEYIKNVPQEIIDYCNEVDMPLFTLPWQVKLVDIIKEFCNRIIHNDNIEDSIASTIKNIIFDVGDKESNLNQMERYGYKQDYRMCFICINMPNLNDGHFEENMEMLSHYAERTARDIQDLFIKFTYNSMLILILTEYSDEQVENFVEEILGSCRNNYTFRNVHIGIGSNIGGILEQGENINKAIDACKLATKQDIEVMYYDKMKEYKLLLSIKNKEILKEYYNEILGRIEEYDRNNNTDLLEFLEVYIKNNCSTQLVAENLYIHRNTVNNQIKKIEKVTGFDMADIETKSRCFLGFLIRDILL